MVYRCAGVIAYHLTCWLLPAVQTATPGTQSETTGACWRAQPRSRRSVRARYSGPAPSDTAIGSGRSQRVAAMVSDPQGVGGTAVGCWAGLRIAMIFWRASPGRSGPTLRLRSRLPGRPGKPSGSRLHVRMGVSRTAGPRCAAHDALISHDILTLGSESPAHIGRRRNRQHGGLGAALGSCASTAGVSAFGTWARDGLWEQGGAGCTMARRPSRTLRTVAAPERAPGWLACSARNRMRAEKSPESYFAFITKRVPTIVRR